MKNLGQHINKVAVTALSVICISSCSNSSKAEISSYENRNLKVAMAIKESNTFMERCMKSAGYKTIPMGNPEPLPRRYFLKVGKPERRYFRQKFGYGLTTASSELDAFVASAGIRETIPAMPAELKGAERTAFDAQQAICGEQRDADPEFQNADRGVQQATKLFMQKESVDSPAMRNWSKCMYQTAKASFRNRTSLLMFLEKKLSAGALTPSVETAFASAEFECSMNSQLDPYAGP
jgi:hypothetical protein